MAGALLLTIGVSGCLSTGSEGPPGAPGGEAGAIGPRAVAVHEACFDTSVPGLGPALIRGTRYLGEGAKVAVVLLHGAVLPRGVWTGDAGGDGPASPAALAPALARAGYAVFVPDRLGYGMSPWTGGARSGAQLTDEAQLATIHDVVQAVRGGGARLASEGDPCEAGAADGAGFDKVMLGGHSSGAVLTLRYGALHEDVDALFPFMFYLAPLGSRVGTHFAACRAEPPTADGYAPLFCPTGDTVSPCAAFMFRADDADPEDIEAGCRGAMGGRDPVGSLATGTRWAEYREMIRDIPAGLPVLRGAADFDDIWEDGRGTAVREQDLAVWRANCPCNVTDFVQPKAGHLWWLHRSAPTVAPAVLAWLAASGLGP